MLVAHAHHARRKHRESLSLSNLNLHTTGDEHEMPVSSLVDRFSSVDMAEISFPFPEVGSESKGGLLSTVGNKSNRRSLRSSNDLGSEVSESNDSDTTGSVSEGPSTSKNTNSETEIESDS